MNGTLWYHNEPGGWEFWNADNRYTQNPAATAEKYEYKSNGDPNSTATGTDFAYGGPS